MRSMVIVVPQLSGPSGVLHVPVSLPYASQLVDHVKYLEPQDVKPEECDTERRRYRHRGPSLRSLVKLALRCESAEQLGKKIRQRYKHQRHQGGGRPRREDRELEDRLDKLLAR